MTHHQGHQVDTEELGSGGSGRETATTSFLRYINVKSLCCTPETNIILYVNYALIKKRFTFQNKKKNKGNVQTPLSPPPQKRTG